MTWKSIENYEGLYEIADTGVIRSLTNGNRKGKVLKPALGTTGYFYVNLSKQGKVKLHKIHRVVAKHFLPLNSSKLYVNHKDGNKLNNDVINLEWCTSLENNRHARNVGLSVDVKGEKHGNSKFKDSDILEMRKLCPSNPTEQDFKTLAIQFGTSPQNMRSIIFKKTWKHI